MKKNIKSLIIVAMALASLGNINAVADTDNFSTNFEEYYIGEVMKDYLLEDGKTHTLLTNGKPLDDNYSDTNTYPGGKYYQGNAANNIYVRDYQGQKIYGGLDGWVGYYSLPSSAYVEYNASNRRNSVVKMNTSHYSSQLLRLEPSRMDGDAYATFGRENINLDGISVWESDVSVSAGTDQENPFETGLYLTRNPVMSGNTYEKSINIVSLSGTSLKEGQDLKISFMGTEVYTHKVGSFYGDPKFITIKYVLDRSGEDARHWIELKKGTELVAYTEPTTLNDDFFADNAIYGILYRTDSNKANNIQPRMLVDNISFYKKEKPVIENKEQLSVERLSFTGDSIVISVSGEVEDAGLEKINIKDQSGQEVAFVAEAMGNSVKITIPQLSPQSVYGINIDKMPIDKFFELSDTLYIRTNSYIEILSGVCTVSEGKGTATIKVGNNTDQEKTVYVIVTVNNKDNAVLSGVHYKKAVIGANSDTDIIVNDIAIPEEEYTLGVYTLNSFTGLCAMSDKFIISTGDEPTPPPTPTPPPDPPVVDTVEDIYLCIGAQNMAGRMDIGEFDRNGYENISLFNGTEFEAATCIMSENVWYGFNRYTTLGNENTLSKLSPAQSFAKKIRDLTGKNVGIVMLAVEGSTVDTWQKGYSDSNDYDLYETAVANAKKAIQESNGALKGIIWLQGEAGTVLNNASKKTAYAEKVEAMIEDFRTDFENQDIPFVTAHVYPKYNAQKFRNEALDMIDLDNVDIVTCDGLMNYNNGILYDSTSIRTLGERFAEKINNLNN